MQRISKATVLALTLVGLAACDKSADEATEPSRPSESSTSRPASESTTSQPDDEEADVEDLGPTPLGEFFGRRSVAKSGFDEEAFRAREEEVAACMRAEGFEYKSALPAGTGTRPADDLLDHAWGITTTPEAMQAPPSSRPADPTQSPAEKEAYDRALYGTPKHLPNGEVQFDPPGCLARVGDSPSAERWEQIRQHQQQRQQLDDQLRELTASLERQVAADPRLVEAKAAFAACMADAGYPEVTDPATDSGSALVEQRAVEAGLFTDISHGGKDGTRQYNDIDPAVLAELQAFERAVFAAELRCHEEYRTAEHEVRVELETAFIEEHRAELERLRDQLALREQPD